MSDEKPEPQADAADLSPHRGALVIVLGIISLTLGILSPVALFLVGRLVPATWIVPPTFVGSVVTGLAAWIMGGIDLRAMTDRRMDPSGRNLTEIGKSIGTAAVTLAVIIVALFLLASLRDSFL